MKKILLSIFIFTQCLGMKAQTPRIAIQLGNENATKPLSLQSDGTNVYAIGEFSGELNTTINSDKQAVFITKYASGKEFTWGKSIHSEDNEIHFISSQIDAEGNIIALFESGGLHSLHKISSDGAITLLGNISSNATLNDFILNEQTITVCGTVNDKLFVATYQLTGTEIWKLNKDLGGITGKKVVQGNDKQIIIVGESELNDLTLISLSENGSTKWTKKIEGNASITVDALTYLPSGQIIMGGSTKSNSLTLDGVAHATTSKGSSHLIALSLTEEGDFHWMYTAGASSIGMNANIEAIYRSENDEIYLGGYCSDKVIFNPNGSNSFNLPDRGGKDAFLIQLNKEGEVLDAKRFGDQTDETLKGIAFTHKGARLHSLIDFKGRTQFGTFYDKTNLVMSGTSNVSVQAIGQENNLVLANYDYVQLFAKNVSEAIKDQTYYACVYHLGGFRKVTYSLLSGTLPTGMLFTEQGDLLGSPSEVGTYNLTVKGVDELGNSSIISFPLTVSNSSGIDNENIENLARYSVYPNPAKEFFTIKSNDESIDKFNLQLFNMAGSLVMNENVQNTERRVNINHLPTGVYFLKCSDGSSVWSEKIIINQ